MSLKKAELSLSKDRKEFRIVDGQVGSPTWTFTLSQVITKIVQTRKNGIFHVTDKAEKKMESGGINLLRELQNFQASKKELFR